jgi:ABC-type cobalamin/Fe3+-siderophores transport system ATPase subunit
VISKIRLKFGRAAGLPQADIDLSPVTIFVGPNNSGKSKILNEIESFAQNGQKHVGNLILDDVSFSGLVELDAEESILRLSVPPNQNEHLAPTQVIFASRHGRTVLDRSQLKSVIQDPAQNVSAFAQWYLRHLTLKLDGPSRIGLVNPQPAGDLQRLSHSTLLRQR